MSKKMFTIEEVDKLSKIKYVKSISEKGITYTDEFKRIFISEHKKGMMPVEIFKSSGFDIEIIGYQRIKSSSYRWRKSYRDNGELGLTDSRKEHSGRPRTKDLTMEEKLARLESQVEFLKIENEFLKKLDMIERQMMTKSKKKEKR